MAETEVLQLAAEQHGIVTLAQALERGMSYRQVRTRLADGRWHRLQSGVYRTAGNTETWRQRLLAVCLAAGPEALVSHRAAGRLWQLDGLSAEPVEIVAPPNKARRLSRAKTYSINGTQPADRRVVDGIPVCGPELTLLQLAGAFDNPELLEIVLDDMLRRGLTTLPRLRWRLRTIGRRGRAGTTALRELLSEHDPNRRAAASVLERSFLDLIRRHGVADPVMQYTVTAQKQFVARVDCCWPDRKAVVELDGRRYHEGLSREWADNWRQNRLELLGYNVLRFSWHDVHQRGGTVVHLVRSALSDSPEAPVVVPLRSTS